MYLTTMFSSICLGFIDRDLCTRTGNFDGINPDLSNPFFPKFPYFSGSLTYL